MGMLRCQCFAFNVLLSENKEEIDYFEGVCRVCKNAHQFISKYDKMTCSLVFVCFFNIQQDYCYPRDSLGKVLYFVDKAEQVVNRLVSFHISLRPANVTKNRINFIRLACFFPKATKQSSLSIFQLVLLLRKNDLFFTTIRIMYSSILLFLEAKKLNIRLYKTKNCLFESNFLSSKTVFILPDACDYGFLLFV